MGCLTSGDCDTCCAFHGRLGTRTDLPGEVRAPESTLQSPCGSSGVSLLSSQRPAWRESNSPKAKVGRPALAGIFEGPQSTVTPEKICVLLSRQVFDESSLLKLITRNPRASAVPSISSADTLSPVASTGVARRFPKAGDLGLSARIGKPSRSLKRGSRLPERPCRYTIPASPDSGNFSCSALTFSAAIASLLRCARGNVVPVLPRVRGERHEGKYTDAFGPRVTAR